MLKGLMVSMFPLWIIFILILPFLFSCNDDHCFLSQFSGISSTDANGAQLSAKDVDDWNLDDEWDIRESNLFDSNLDIACIPTFDYVIIAYPNPCNGTFALHLEKDSTTSVELRLVNDDCNTLVKLDGITSNEVHLHPDNEDQIGIARLYYKFIKEGCEFRGHGDISFQ